MTSCGVTRCKRRVSVADLCKTHARQKADRLFSAFIRTRDGRCQAEGDHVGALQCAHLISRRYSATRWLEINAVALCAGHHTYFTHRPVEWTDWIEKRLGELKSRLLRQRALEGARPDLAHVIAYLEAA